MGTVNIVFASVGGASGALPAYNGSDYASENVTSGGTSAQSSAALFNCAARIATDTAVYVKAGVDPTAAAGTAWLVHAGSTLDLFIGKGDKIAVIDV